MEFYVWGGKRNPIFDGKWSRPSFQNTNYIRTLFQKFLNQLQSTRTVQLEQYIITRHLVVSYL